MPAKNPLCAPHPGEFPRTTSPLSEIITFVLFSCSNRYTHANRTCPLHPYSKPQRSAELVLQPTLAAGEDPNQVSRWLENYRRERMDKTPAKVGTPW